MTDRPIRVLHCLGWIQSGGVEVCHLELVKALGDRFSHRFVCMDAGGQVAEQLAAHGVEIYELGEVGSVFDPRRYRTTLRIAREWKPDIIHGAVMEGVVPAGLVGMLTGIPVVAEETSDPADRRWKGHLLARLAYASAERCVAVSAAVGDYLRESLRVPEAKIAVLLNGVRKPDILDVAEAAGLRRQLGIQESDVVVGTVSRVLDDCKRISDLIAGVEVLVHQLPQLHLLIVGDGPDLNMLQRLARETGNGDHFHFVGRHNPADRFYSIMDIFALASQREAFGLVAAEAMRAGLPVVTTDVGGLSELVADGVTGFLVPPKSPVVLAEALQRLVTDRGLRLEMGAAGRVRADNLFSSERYARDMEQIYRSVLAK